MKLNVFVGSMVLGATLCSTSFAGLLDRMLGCRNTGCDTACCDTVIADPSCGCEMAAPCGSGCGIVDPSCGCEMAAPCGSGCGIVDPSCGCEMNACEPSCGVEVVSCCKPRRKPILGLLKRVHCGAHNLADRLTSFGGCCDSGCDMGCGIVDPSCGCEMAAPCGIADPSCGCEMAAPCGSGCGMVDPSCGCEMAAPCGGCADACDSGCAPRCGGLLSKLFKRRCNTGCDTFVGCDTGCSSCATAAPAASGCSGCSGAVSAPVMNAAPAPAPAPVVDPSAYLNSKRRVIQASTTLP